MIRACECSECCNFFSYDTWRQAKKRFCSKKCKGRYEYENLTDEQKERRREQQARNKRERWAALTDEEKSEEYKYYRDRWKNLSTEQRKRELMLKSESVDREKRRKRVRNWKRYNYANNLEYRLTHVLRSRLGSAIRGTAKAASTKELIGCSIKHLRAHLERQFTAGMSWDNYGDWHIDHIRPCASFDLTDPGQQRECFNYTNLQPLWAEDNMKKGASYEQTHANV